MLASYERILHSSLESGDEERIQNAFEMIYQDFSKLVAFSISKYIDDRESIRDLVNEVFVRFFENAYKLNTSVKYYLLIIARNVAIDYLKKSRRFEQIEMDIPYDNKIENVLGYQDLVNDLKSILTNKEVEIIISHAVDGYSFREIGEHFNITEKNASTIYNRAIKKFKAETKRRY